MFFHQSHIGLLKWFIGIFIVLNAKKSISSLQLHRELGITKECTWHMVHGIRKMMQEDESQAGLFRGLVQAEEMYVGSSICAIR